MAEVDQLTQLINNLGIEDGAIQSNEEISLEEELKEEFLNPSNLLPWDILDLIQDIPKDEPERVYDSLLQLPEPISRTSFRLKRRGIEGKVVDYEEKLLSSELKLSNAATSISIKREYTSKDKSLKGSTSFLPFRPGGIQLQQGEINDGSLNFHRDDDGLFDLPQGLTRGLKVGGTGEIDVNGLESNDAEQPEANEEEEETVEEELEEIVKDDATNNEFEKEIDELLPVDISFGRALIHKELENQKRKDWAHVVDLNHKIENFDELIPNMARKWPFELDTFQQEAVYHLEHGDSVFVAAHTSAGKTVVAEYAIAMAARNMTKAIYTSPIKALSNQKFRDFKETFTDIDVGLITGDVQINPEANCLIMTTEILRSMLYRGADLIRDVEFVIFDEVHYVNDIDRGVVWEEVIIMLPDHVKFILLSATVPNTFEFANWVGRTKKKDIYVISTPKRPVPLEISIWAKKKLIKVVDAEKKFLEKNFNEHIELLEPKKADDKKKGADSGARGGRGGRGGNRGGGRGGAVSGRGGRGGFSNNNNNNNFKRFQVDRPNKNTWMELVQYLNSNTLFPVVIFVFSKKRCEEYANTLKGIDFCNAREKSQIHMFIDQAVARLKKEDRELPQILAIREMLSRGIAVHHGGLLPIVKEVIEILFSKTLIKVLFATETFAMGLNLPTRTVVFSELRKHDGNNFRNLLPGEFTQMSGRAGRRGLDKFGTVIIMAYNQPLTSLTFKEVTLGTPTKLVSQFRLTYNMILNLLRIEALRVEEMIKHSFGENTAQNLLPEHEKKVKELEGKLVELPDFSANNQDESLIDAQLAHDDLVKYKELTKQIMIESYSHPVISKFFKVARVVVFEDEVGIRRIGVIVRSDNFSDPVSFVMLCFNQGARSENQTVTGIPYLNSIPNFFRTCFDKVEYSGGLRTVKVPLDKIEMITNLMVRVNINALLQSDPQMVKDFETQMRTMVKFFHKYKEINWNFATLKLHELVTERQKLVEDMSGLKSLSNKKFKMVFKEIHDKYEIEQKIEYYKSMLSDENLELLPDYEQRLEVLKDLKFVDENSNVVLKGRVACEINSGWELVLTELVFDNFLGDFEPEEIVALLSCFVYEGSGSSDEDDNEPVITPRLEKGKDKIKWIFNEVLTVCNGHQVTLTKEEESFLERKRFGLVNVVYEWARGMTFNEIMKLSVEAEGTIVRVITRLDEVCREVKSAALIIGDSTLHSKMAEAQEKIKRDIVFCASLYL